MTCDRFPGGIEGQPHFSDDGPANLAWNEKTLPQTERFGALGKPLFRGGVEDGRTRAHQSLSVDYSVVFVPPVHHDDLSSRWGGR